MKLKVGITQENRFKLYFHCGSLKNKPLKKSEFLNIKLKLNVKKTHKPTSN